MFVHDLLRKFHDVDSEFASFVSEFNKLLFLAVAALVSTEEHLKELKKAYNRMKGQMPPISVLSHQLKLAFEATVAGAAHLAHWTYLTSRCTVPGCGEFIFVSVEPHELQEIQNVPVEELVEFSGECLKCAAAREGVEAGHVLQTYGPQLSVVQVLSELHLKFKKPVSELKIILHSVSDLQFYIDARTAEPMIRGSSNDTCFFYFVNMSSSFALY
jgi:hypothetical protein